jgi:hypothetical protein
MKIMRTFILFVIMLTALFASAQNVKTVRVEKERFNLLQEMSLHDQFLEPKFQMGTVVFKNGKTASRHLNYNVVANAITFLDDKNRVFILEGFSDIHIITFGKRQFIPINNVEVAEVLETFSNGSSLVLRRQAKIKNDFDNRGGYGTSTEAATAVSRYKTVTQNGITYNFDNRVEVNITLTSSYLLLVDGKTLPINRFSNLKKYFPTKWQDAKEFAKENNFDFKKPESVLAIVRFCNQ